MDIKAYHGVFVFVEMLDGAVSDVTLELLGEGTKLAEHLNTTVTAVLPGDGSLQPWDILAKHWIKLQKINSLRAALFISMIALCWDLNVDPVATGLGLWTWNARLPAWFFGVPLVNFTSWFSAVFAFGVGYTVITRSRVSEKKKTAAMFAVIPLLLLAAAVINFGICGIAEGFGGPAWTVMMQFWK